MQVGGNCNALWLQGQMDVPTVYCPILIITVWDAIALLWKYSISRPPKMKCNYNVNPPRKKFENQVAYLVKKLSDLAKKIVEMEKEPLARPIIINLTFSTLRDNIKNYFFRASIRGKQGETKEERTQIYQKAAKRIETMKSMFSNVQTKKKMKGCKNSWGQCSESVPWCALHGKKTTRKHRATLYYRTVDLNGNSILPCLHCQAVINSTHLAIIRCWYCSRNDRE
jgi:hypothetical protein